MAGRGERWVTSPEFWSDDRPVLPYSMGRRLRVVTSTDVQFDPPSTTRRPSGVASGAQRWLHPADDRTPAPWGCARAPSDPRRRWIRRRSTDLASGAPRRSTSWSHPAPTASSPASCHQAFAPDGQQHRPGARRDLARPTGRWGSATFRWARDENGPHARPRVGVGRLCRQLPDARSGRPRPVGRVTVLPATRPARRVGRSTRPQCGRARRDRGVTMEDAYAASFLRTVVPTGARGQRRGLQCRRRHGLGRIRSVRESARCTVAPRRVGTRSDHGNNRDGCGTSPPFVLRGHPRTRGGDEPRWSCGDDLVRIRDGRTRRRDPPLSRVARHLDARPKPWTASTKGRSHHRLQSVFSPR
jgi:hypothetical protein